jgi:cell division septation protein DedD
MNPELPGGIVYKVQIGAFNRPVSDDAFGGITPVAGEKKGNLIRYTAGLFVAFNEASGARQTLNGLGYKDAFIVAYCNGVRISVSKAREYERQGGDCSTDALAGNNAGSEQRVAGNNNVAATADKNEISTEANSNVSVKEIAAGATLPQKGFEVVKGLVYTVQVGVYSRPVTAGQLFNIQPLYYDRTAKGLYRYATGVYNNMPDAVKAKNRAVEIGISDAFVTAYFEGKRVSMTEAGGMVAKNGQTVFIERDDMNRMPSQLRVLPAGTNRVAESPAKETVQPAIDPVKPETARPENNVSSMPANIEYKVQIGAFRKEVPVEMMNKFLSIAAMGISAGKTDDGLTIYSVGKFKDYASAEKVKSEVQAQGITDAFVAPYNNGKRISLEEARKLDR